MWDNPATGASTFTSPAPGIVANIPAVPNAVSTATLGIHARSGTLYTLDRTGSRPIYRYSMSNPTGGWTSFASGVPTATSAAITDVNFNKMTVIGDKLLVANSISTVIYTYDITPATGALTGPVATEGMGFDGQTPGTSTTAPFTGVGDPPGTTGISGGDIAQDEYGKVYMLTYDNSTGNVTPTATRPVGATVPQYVYFYEKSGNQWIYKDRALKDPIVTNGVNDYTEQFAGFAIYADTFYVKGTTSGNLYKLPLTRTGNDYNWSGNNSSLEKVLPGTGGNGSADLATCGVPAINVTKTQSIFTTLAASGLDGTNAASTDQTQLVTGQYIKYTIVGTNVGDAWARNSYINDTLPLGVDYVPNSATENGVNLNAATYPFTPSGTLAANATVATGANTPIIGQIRLPFLGNSNTVTYTYIVKVNGTAPNVSNQAEIGYTNPYPSDPPNCTTGLNCGVTALKPLLPSIFGNVWNDINGSAAGTFTNIRTGTEIGTNAGTTVGATNALYAILLNSAGKQIASSPVAADGSYKFLGLSANQTGLNIQLSTTAGTGTPAAPGTPPTVAIPTGWKATSPKATSSTAIAPNPVTSFNLALIDVLDKDFGITLPAGIILVKRITAITDTNGVKTDFTTVVEPTTTTTTNDDATRKWPTGYLKGAVNGGTVKPGDKIEYTIYYLNDGSADTKKLKICDPIRGNHQYVPGSMKMLPGGAVDTLANQIPLTDLVDTAVDRANSYLPGAANVPTNCNAIGSTAGGTDNGGVAIEITGTGASPQPTLTAIPGATAAGTPTTSYGWFRFTTKVNP